MAPIYWKFSVAMLLAGAAFSAHRAHTRTPAIECAALPVTDSNRKRVVIIGGGIMGACTAHTLASRGHSVVLLDAGHPIRSSWGESRIARLAYDDPLYVKMQQRAFDLWDELAKKTGLRLRYVTGSIDIGSPRELAPLLRTYQTLRLPHIHFRSDATQAPPVPSVTSAIHQLISRAGVELPAHAMQLLFPQLALPPTKDAVFQPDGSMMLADVCVRAATDAAVAAGACVREDEAVVRVDRKSKTVYTEQGHSYQYDTLCVCAGPWNNFILRTAGLSLLPFIASNEQQVFLLPKSDTVLNDLTNTHVPSDVMFGPDHFPTVIWRDSDNHGADRMYALPAVPGGTPGVKVALHRHGRLMANDEFVAPAGLPLNNLPNRDKQPRAHQDSLPDAERRQEVLALAAQRLPLLDATRADTYLRCIYTNIAAAPETRPDDFVIGHHPEDERVVLVGGFNGSGFKFGPVVGEFAADLVEGRPPAIEGMREAFTPVRLPMYRPDSLMRGREAVEGEA
mmetsp:Transcript_49701/g.124945  ORF Transcript_49701/g.124945 Transcript_49701/m.124945 type:complete len:508 (+) Transcript_49701:91-1614(+)